MAKAKAEKKEEKNAGGRPRTVTPEEWTDEQLKEIDDMAEAQCKDCMIAEVLGVDAKCFQREFAKRTRQKRAFGKRRVLRAQFEGCFAEGAGSVTERIWFGKQHLEQTDRAAVEHSGTVAPVLSIKVDAPEKVAPALPEEAGK